MYLGIDFLIGPDLAPKVVEVNAGLPGGATEYDRAFQTRHGRPSGVFEAIERISRDAVGLTFPDYLGSLPFVESLKAAKLWLDGRGPFPERFHAALRLEDKWVQARILRKTFPYPETIPFDPARPDEARDFLRRKGRLVSKIRSGRGGRGFRMIESPSDLEAAASESEPRILQEWIDSRVDRFSFSVRAVAFAGRWVCAYANLAERAYSNHGTIAVLEEGDGLRLASREFITRRFDERSWEAEIWFGVGEPGYLHHNLYEDEAAETALLLPPAVFALLRDTAVRIERFYDGLDFSALPPAWFEIHRPALPGDGLSC
jgi:hypothetical protein